MLHVKFMPKEKGKLGENKHKICKSTKEKAKECNVHRNFEKLLHFLVNLESTHLYRIVNMLQKDLKRL